MNINLLLLRYTLKGKNGFMEIKLLFLDLEMKYPA